LDENSATFRAGLKQVIDRGKKNLLGVLVDAVDYEAAVERIIDAAHAGRPLAASALAVHGVMTGVQDRTHRYRLNHLDMVTPDGQPVRWALNALHGTGLTERVYGPTLTLKLCERAQREGLAIYLYGSQIHVLQALALRLKCLFPRLIVAGWEPSRFRSLSAEEAQEADSRIRASGARITLVGLGCPRQEVWVYEHREALSMPTLAVGAAFDFHAGRLPQAPMLLQRIGLEWAYRLVREPRRLWRR
jgi:exopolysaccharide biosynthesis WecB/TagA/CpsF family protein